MKRRLLLGHVLEVEAGACLDQEPADGDVAARRREVQRREALGVAAVHELLHFVVLQLRHHHIEEALLAGRVEVHLDRWTRCCRLLLLHGAAEGVAEVRGDRGRVRAVRFQ